MSPLKVNEGLGQLETWNEEEIKIRAQRLAGQAVDVWVAPKLSDEILEVYRPAKDESTVYTREDHSHLSNPVVAELFDAFRKEVLALDECVTEDFLKLYIAYKAETNFVDVIPQAKRLKLSINMEFADINDPRGLCVDVTGLGRWGNGNVMVTLDSLDKLPYIMGLVRQSLEMQLGDE